MTLNHKKEEGLFHEQWVSLTSHEQLSKILEKSQEKPVALFKHSTQCGISVSSQSELFSNWDLTANDVDFYHLDILNYHSISNAIADRVGVIHQSPQLIVLKNGNVISVTTHHTIKFDKFKKELKDAS